MFTKDKSFYGTFRSLYPIIVLQNIIILSVTLVDNIMIGSYSETALAGVAAVNQIQFLFQQLITASGDTIVVLGSQYWGQQRTGPIRKISAGAMLIGVSFGLFLFLMSSLFPGQIVHFFTPSQEIVSEGVKYLNIIRFTYLVFPVTMILLATLRSVERVRIAFWVSVSSLICNCSINYLLIAGNFGAPEMGVRGAAVGTLVARCLELAIVVCYLIFADKRLHLRITDYFHIDRTMMKDYLKVGLPTIVVGALFGASTLLQSVILGHMNDTTLAANAVSTSLYQVLKVMSIGASSTTGIIIGKTIGTGNIEKIKEYTRTLQWIFLGIGLITSILLFVLRFPILSLYDLTEETKQLANSYILVLCVTGIGTAYEMPVLTGIVRGGGDAKFVLYNDLISIWGIVLPLSFLAAFVFGWSSTAVVFCLNFDQIFKCGAAAIKVNRYNWIKKLTRPTA